MKDHWRKIQALCAAILIINTPPIVAEADRGLVVALVEDRVVEEGAGAGEISRLSGHNRQARTLVMNTHTQLSGQALY
jgi:hypothetical protein